MFLTKFNYITFRVTINKNSDYDIGSDSLKRISGPEKPNNQTKVVGGASIPNLQMKCNILKGMFFLNC